MTVEIKIIIFLGSIDSSKVISPENHEFQVPQRAVTSMEGMELWLKSEAYLVSARKYNVVQKVKFGLRDN